MQIGDVEEAELDLVARKRHVLVPIDLLDLIWRHRELELQRFRLFLAVERGVQLYGIQKNCLRVVEGKTDGGEGRSEGTRHRVLEKRRSSGTKESEGDTERVDRDRFLDFKKMISSGKF